MNKRDCAPLVSIIIPIYKVEKYLEKCLDSAVNQTLKNIEIICVDDGSPDNCGAMADAYAEKYDNVTVIHQENRGLSGARNTGLDAATGKYVYFLDSDDWIELNAMEELCAKAEELQVEMLSFDARMAFESEYAKTLTKENELTHFRRSRVYGGRIYTGQELFVLMRNPANDWPYDWHYGVWLVLFQRAFLEKHHIRFCEGIIHEDVPFSVICCMLAQRVAHEDKVYYNHLTRENSIMTNKSANRNRNAEGYAVGCAEILHFLKENPAEPETEADLYKMIHTNWNKGYRECMRSDPSIDSWNLSIGGQDARMVFHVMKNTAALRKERDDLKAKIKKYEKILYIPLKIRGGIRCLKQHGLRYTVSRTLQKINNKLHK